MRFRFFSLLCSLVFMLVIASVPQALAQQATPRMTNEVEPTPVAERLASFETRQMLQDNSLVAQVPLRNVGPTVMSGRVVDIEANPADPTHFYVAYASGGLWKTETNGISFEPMFEKEAVMTLGDIAVDWSNGETIWVGTGENNSSRSSYAGAGVYKSTDAGATWQHMGLAATQRTGRVLIHPDDPNTVWVAAIGALYAPSEDRGVYKTTDGGQTWTKELYVDTNTGAIDLVLDPTDPDVLYATMWHRERRAWNFVEAGPGSGIYKSTDGGANWTLLSTEDSGFPTGEGVGRIGLAVYPDNPQIVFAFLDNQYRRPDDDEADEEEGLTRDALREMSSSDFLALDDELVEEYLEDNNFPSKYTVERVRELVSDGTIEPVALVEYLEDANSQLFDTPVIGAEVYRSDDGGQTWRRTHDDFLDRVYNSYGYYFGEIRVAPDTPERIYIMGVPILRSDDGGSTFTSIGAPHVHVDHHALWVNPNRPGHLINGNDGGVNISYDDGETWFKANTPAVGQFYAVQVDNAEPYRVYGGLQDNGVWVGPSTYQASQGWYGDGDYPFDGIMGGDGMQVEVDTRTNEVVYTGFQFGFYSRIDRSTGDRISIRPRHELGERPLRFNWQTPIHLSRHQQDILYYAANRVYRSFNGGADLNPISPDLTRGGRPGDVPYGTIATIDESPLRFGLLYAGSDDGYVHVTRDGGGTWTPIHGGLPEHMWVSRVEASHHAEGRVYVTLNGYRWDHFDAYVYMSDDYGSSWTRIGRDLPKEPVNVILEDPENADVLYVGTDHGLYVSVDRGQSFMGLFEGMPDVAVHDLKYQAREHELVVGTHGRSIYVADVAHIQAMTPQLMAQSAHLFDTDPVMYSTNWGQTFSPWGSPFEPGVDIAFYTDAAQQATIRILSESDEELQRFMVDATRGLNYTTYDLSIQPDAASDDQEAAPNGVVYLMPGTYTIAVDAGGETATTTLEVRERRRGGNAEPKALMGPSGAYEIK